MKAAAMRRKGQRGFSLIELGIVVAVIAILATVVLVGRGFLESSRVSKMVEVIDTIAKGTAVYAGTNGGEIPTAPVNYLNALELRALVPTGITNSVPNFAINSVSRVSTETFVVSITCSGGAQAATSCQDICRAKLRDKSLVTATPSATCANPAATITLTFQI